MSERVRWRSHAVRSLIVVALVTALGGFDWYLRNWEMSWLLVAVETSEMALVEGGEAVASAGRAGLPPLMRSRAVESARRIADTGDQVGLVLILPWHLPELDAQAKYLDHSDAWIRYMESVAAGKTNLNQERIDIGSTFQIAHRRFERATPIVPLFDLRERVADVFDD